MSANLKLSRPRLRYQAAVVGALCLLAVAGCGHTSAPSGTASTTAVAVTHPKRQALVRIVEQPGTIQPYEETLLYARVPGYVGKLRREVDIGYQVRGPKYDKMGKEIEPGEELAELVVPELRQEVNLKHALTRQAEAEVGQARKAAVSAKASIETMEASVAEAKALKTRWESESKRMEGLVKSGTVDLQSREEIHNQFEAAGAKLLSTEAAVRKAQADYGKALADVEAAEARLESTRADAQRSETMLAYATIRAPFDGVISARKVSTGDLVQPGATGEWLFRIARRTPVRAVLDVPEADADLIEDKEDAEIAIPAKPGPAVSGKVARTAWTLEPGTRTLRTEIDLDNEDGRLRPGMYVYAHIANKLPESWTLPVTAVVKQSEATICFRIVDGKAMRTSVLIGRSDGKSVVVLKRQLSGSTKWTELTADDVIAQRAAGLTDGQTVQIEEAKP